MPSRCPSGTIQGAEPDSEAIPGWTGDDVERWLVSSLRVMKQTSILVLPGNRHTAAGQSETPDATFNILAFAGTVLGQGTIQHRALLFWARIRADGIRDETGIRDWASAHGITTVTFFRWRKRACETIAEAKNKRDRDAREGKFSDPS